MAIRSFATGSMGAKVQAAGQFVAATGHPAAIGRLEDALAILRSEAGTKIEAGIEELEAMP